VCCWPRKPDPWLTEFLDSEHVEQLTSHTIVDYGALRRELDVVREQGWALVDREYEDHVCSLAAPVTDQRGEVVAAVSVSKLADESDISDTLAHLLTAARAISDDACRSASPDPASIPTRSAGQHVPPVAI
jgi:DNA-binding IclR family transcriptional regulator